MFDEKQKESRCTLEMFSPNMLYSTEIEKQTASLITICSKYNETVNQEAISLPMDDLFQY